MYPTLRRNAQAIRSSISTGSSLGYALLHKPSPYGQPLHPSHPHLVRPNELNAGVPYEEYENRRHKLIQSLPENSMVVLTAAPITFMSGEIFYKFRQQSDFWYLTGCEEPDAAVILEKNSSPRGYSMSMFVADKDSQEEKWSGPTTGVLAAGEIFRADDCQSIKNFPSVLRSVASAYSHIYADLPPQKEPDSYKKLLRKLSNTLTQRSYDHDSVMSLISSSRRRPLRPKIGLLRAIKSDVELAIMGAAAKISGRAHAKTMRFTHPGMSESAIAAHFEYICALDGAQRPAYVPVVASGANALVIHYTHNNMVIQNEDLLLIDAGCEYNGYASDITRTYPANGSFSTTQADLYSAVLSAQKALISMCHEGEPITMLSLHSASCRLLRSELAQIGINVSTEQLSKDLYPHSLSHPIGIDLHEMFTINRNAQLRKGMVITIEPGIYVPPLPQYPKHFHNMGIRIEDEVAIGESGPTVLSVSAPKEIADVEGACQGLLGLQPY